MKQQNTNTEIEVRFLDIDIPNLKKRLIEIGAEDQGEDFLRETIFYDQEATFPKLGKVIRIRSTKSQSLLAFKHHTENETIGTVEIEQPIFDPSQMTLFLEAIGFTAFRQQEKKRHTYTLGETIIDIDTWPTMPSYVELEGSSEKVLKEVAKKLNLEWEKAIRQSAAYVIEHFYHIPVKSLKYFTFERIE